MTSPHPERYAEKEKIGDYKSKATVPLNCYSGVLDLGI